MFEQVKAIIVEELGVDPEEVTLTAHIIDDLGADSLDVVELMMALEETFDLSVSDEQAQTLRTVGDVVDYLQRTS
ncbi:MAG: acyl carrier protein [Acholeplasmatales bacterium]|nr:MAG: acyl carrier protein [Acholeplasmatales bacterium]